MYSPIIKVSHIAQVLCQVAHRHTFYDYYMKNGDSGAKDNEYVQQKENIDLSDKVGLQYLNMT